MNLLYVKAEYFQNPNFCNRVSFNFDLLENKHITLSEILELLFSGQFARWWGSVAEFAAKKATKLVDRGSIVMVVR